MSAFRVVRCSTFNLYLERVVVMFRVKFLALLAMGLAVCWLGAQVRADTLMLDTFNAPDGALNSSLGSPRQSGTLMPAGGFDYYSSSVFLVSSNQAFLNNASTSSGYAFQNQDETSLVGTKYTVSMDLVNLTPLVEDGALAVVTAKTQSSYFPNASGAMLMIDGTGAWGLYGNYASLVAGSVAAKSSYNVAMDIDETGASTVVTARIDGNVVGSGSFVWDSGDRYVAFGGVVRGQSNWHQTFDNLQLTTIPEPSSIAILASAMIGLLAYAWRRRR